MTGRRAVLDLIRPLRRVVLAFAFLVLAPAASRADPAWPDLSRPPSAADRGVNDAAVIVGIERYAFVAPMAHEDAELGGNFEESPACRQLTAELDDQWDGNDALTKPE